MDCHELRLIVTVSCRRIYRRRSTVFVTGAGHFGFARALRLSTAARYAGGGGIFHQKRTFQPLLIHETSSFWCLAGIDPYVPILGVACLPANTPHAPNVLWPLGQSYVPVRLCSAGSLCGEVQRRLSGQPTSSSYYRSLMYLSPWIL